MLSQMVDSIRFRLPEKARLNLHKSLDFIRNIARYDGSRGAQEQVLLKTAVSQARTGRLHFNYQG